MTTSPENTESLIQFIIPIYNEGENVKVVYQAMLDAGLQFDSLRFVYDFDEDNSLPYIGEISETDPRVVADKNEIGRGVVNALRWGFKHCKPGPVIVIMGDNCDDLTTVPHLIEAWKQGATLVCPSRYMDGGAQHGGEFAKTLLSRIACNSLKALGFPTTDATNNFKLYDGAWLQQQTIESMGGFEVGIELCYKAFAGRKTIVEVPTVWKDRTMGESKFQLLKWMPHYLKWYRKILGALLFKTKAS